MHFTCTISSPYIDSAVVKTQKLFSSHGGYLTIAMCNHRETFLSNKHTMKKQSKCPTTHR